MIQEAMAMRPALPVNPPTRAQLDRQRTREFQQAMAKRLRTFRLR